MAEVLTETLEATGYDNGNWTETVGTGSTVDEDAAAPAELSGSKVLHCISTAADTDNAYTENNDSAMAVAAFHLAFDFSIKDTSDITGTEFINIHQTLSGANAPFSVLVRGASGNVTFRYRLRYDATNNDIVVVNALTEDTRYRVELFWNTLTNLASARLDGAYVFENETLSGGADTWVPDAIRLGPNTLIQAGIGIMYDQIKVNDSVWVYSHVPTLAGFGGLAGPRRGIAA